MASTSEHDTVTDKAIFTVTDELGPDEFQHLYDHLGIPKHKVKIAEKDADTTDQVLKAREVLRWWRQTQGSAVTHKALFDARNKILTKRKGKSAGGSEEFNLQECQDQLRELYLGSDMKVQLTPWDPDHAVFMDAIFVNLELKKDENSSSENKQTPLQKNEDLVTLQTPTGQRVNRILIQGEAGSGKSTLLDNLAYKWALQLDPAQSSTSSLSEFDLVFILRINEINDINDSVEKIIFDQILEDGPNVSQTSLKSYLQSNAQKCLFLIDGLNEDSVGILNSTTADISKVLYNKMYRRSCAIASIRPYKAQAMGLNERKFTKVELTGFSGKNIEEYIKKYFAGKEVNYSSLLQRLKQEPYVWDLARTPLLLMFFCVLWDDPIQAKRNLPNTRTKLYQETIASLWKRYQHKRSNTSEEVVASDDALQKELINFLEALGQVTLEGMLNNHNHREEKVLFKESDFEALFEETEITCLMLALNVGILTRKRFRSKLHMKTSVKFFHTSIQDFCSAVYLASLQLKDNEKCKGYAGKLLNLKRTPWSTRYSEVLVFCAGYKPETAKLITEQIVVKYLTLSDNFGQKNLVFCESFSPSKESLHQLESTFKMFLITDLLFELVFEARLTYEECNKLASILSSTGIPLIFNCTLATAKYIQYQLNLLKAVNDTNTGLLFSTLHEIIISKIELSNIYPLIVSMLKYSKQLCCFILKFKYAIEPSQVTQLSEMFDELADLQHLRELTLYRIVIDAITYGDVDISNTLHKICHLKLHKLELVHVTVTAKSMTEFLCSNNSLVSLTFLTKPCHIMYDTFSMMTAISNIQTLSQLSLGGISIEGAVRCFKSIIPQLNMLQLVNPACTVWTICELFFYLGKAKKLTKLVFGGNLLGTTVNNLADQLKHMVKLKKLSLCATDLGNHGCQILAEGIKSMSSLHHLNIAFNPEIGLEGRKAIEQLRTLPKFHELEIAFDMTPHKSFLLMHEMEVLTTGIVRQTFENLFASSSEQTEPSRVKSTQGRVVSLHTPIEMGTSSTADSSTSPVKLAANKCKPSTAEGPRSLVKRFKQELPSSGQEGVQDSFLPDCRNCMSQIYNGVTKPFKVCCNPTCMRLETEVQGGLKRCKKCKIVQYCRRGCQKDHWKIHKSACGYQSKPSKKDKKQKSIPSKLTHLHTPVVMGTFSIADSSKPSTTAEGQSLPIQRSRKKLQSTGQEGHKCFQESEAIDTIEYDSDNSDPETIIKPIKVCCNPKCMRPELKAPRGLKRCKRCKMVHYCSQECQKDHWKIHKPACAKQSEPSKKDEKQKSTPSKLTHLHTPVEMGTSSTADSKTSPVKLASNKRKTSTTAEGQRSLVKRFRKELPPSGQEDHKSFKESEAIDTYEHNSDNSDPETSLDEPIKVCCNPTCMRPETKVPGSLKHCMRCKMVKYCSRKCQKDHWKIHKSACGKKPI